MQFLQFNQDDLVARILRLGLQQFTQVLRRKSHFWTSLHEHTSRGWRVRARMIDAIHSCCASELRGGQSWEEARRKEGERLRGNFSGSMDFLHAEFASGSDGSKQAQSLHLQTKMILTFSI